MIAADQITPDQLLTPREIVKSLFKYGVLDIKQELTVMGLEYAYSKFVRDDNSLEHAEYLVYIDARILYPEFVPRSYDPFARELLVGKLANVFEELSLIFMR
jgi:hypothetical protein